MAPQKVWFIIMIVYNILAVLEQHADGGLPAISSPDFFASLTADQARRFKLTGKYLVVSEEVCVAKSIGPQKNRERERERKVLLQNYNHAFTNMANIVYINTVLTACPRDTKALYTQSKFACSYTTIDLRKFLTPFQ